MLFSGGGSGWKASISSLSIEGIVEPDPASVSAAESVPATTVVAFGSLFLQVDRRRNIVTSSSCCDVLQLGVAEDFESMEG